MPLGVDATDKEFACCVSDGVAYGGVNNNPEDVIGANELVFKVVFGVVADVGDALRLHVPLLKVDTNL